MHVPDHLVDVFKTEYEATRSLEAAVGAVRTAVLAQLETPPQRVEVQPLPVSGHLRAVPPPVPPQHHPPMGDRVAAEIIKAVLTAVARSHGDTPTRLFDRRWTTRRQAAARWVAAAVLRRMGMSMPEIAREVGFADHTTVLYGLRQVDARAELAAQAEAVWREITAGAAALDPKGAQAQGVAA
jgi:hypothetical protein